MKKLQWLNGHYIKNSPLERITELAVPYLQKAGYLAEELTPEEWEWVKMVVASVREYPSCISEIVEHVDVFFNDEFAFEEEGLKEILQQEQVPQVVEALFAALEDTTDLTPEAAKKILRNISKGLKLGGKKVFMPLRIALTGSSHGPELNE